MIRIAHISDFHLSNDNLFAAEDRIVEPLVKDLKEFHEEEGIDLVVCSGDFVNTGAQSFDSPKEGFDTFTEMVADHILESLNLGRERFIIAPGNHDVVRSADTRYAESGLTHELTSQEKVTSYIEEGSEEGSKRIHAYNDFEKRFYDGACTAQCSRYESVHHFDLDDWKVGVASLNSAWRCYNSGEDAGNIIVGMRQVQRALKALNGCELRIAVMHHPISDLIDFDQKAIRSTVLREFDFLLRGHDHAGSTRTTQVIENAIFTSAAPGVLHRNINSDSRTYANGYQIIDFNPQTQKITTHARRFVESSNAFRANPDNGGEDGKGFYKLPSKAEWKQFEEQRELTKQIQRQYEPGLNQHLLTYGTDTVAPKRIADIFVMPEVVHRRRGEKKGETEEKEFSLGELAESSSNLVILGGREAGKTMLLNRLLTELSENVDEYRQIPVRIDFPEMGNRRVETLVNEFLGVGSTETKRIAEEQSLTLLIDDISFREADKYRIRRLEKFIEEYSKTRIVATHLQQHSGDLPRSHHEKLQFKPVEIKSFRVKQIRALVSNWFVESDVVSTPEQLDNIVSLFQVLDIPRTPFAVSILLWIVEKQEGYRPKNKATMVEKFVERLLQKYEKEEVYSGRFDFKNKQRLLAELAYYMYREGNADYHVSYLNALTFIDKHIKGREFDFNPQPILDSFIETGLLAKSNQQVQFRFECFFEYFLAKKMGFDDRFKETVLSESEYLKFTSEIEYFAGIERDQSDILNLLTKRLKDAYGVIGEELTEEHDSYDNYFMNNFSLVQALDESSALENVEENRPSDKDIESMKDEQLAATVPGGGIRRKELPETPYDRLTRLLFLTAQVLRHTEETDEENLKTKSYQAVIQAALTFTVLYKYALERHLNENEQALPEAFKDMATLMIDYAPVVTQLILHTEVGTRKLNKVFRDEIERIINDEEISDFEKFLSVFLYADNDGIDYTKQIRRLIHKLRYSYAEDSVFIKLIIYFYVRSKSEKLDNELLNLMADVMVKAKGLHPSAKGQIIEEHRKRKQKQRKNYDVDQTALEF